MKKQQETVRLAEQIDEHLRAVRQVLRQPVETEIARGGLTGPQRSVMHAVVHSGSLSLKELSSRVGLAHSTVSGIVDRLQKQGLLERETSAEDRRFTRIAPSKLVNDYVNKTLPLLIRHPLVEALTRAKPAERQLILDGLQTLRRLLDVPL